MLRQHFASVDNQRETPADHSRTYWAN